MQLRATGTVDRMAASEAAAAKAKLPRSRHWSYTLINWLGLVPFLLFCLLFEILPAIMIIQGSLSNSDTGTFTLNNYQRVLNEADKLHAFQNSIYISLVTALIGTVIGFLAAYGVFNLRRRPEFSHGFWTKSRTPSRIDSTARSTVAHAVITMIGKS